MSHGVRIQGKHPKSKKAVKEAMAADPTSVVFYNTSLHGGQDWRGDDPQLPAGLTFVGPDPYTSRVFYGSVKYVNGKVKVL